MADAAPAGVVAVVGEPSDSGFPAPLLTPSRTLPPPSAPRPVRQSGDAIAEIETSTDRSGRVVEGRRRSLLVASLIGLLVLAASNRAADQRSLSEQRLENLRFVRDRSVPEEIDRPFVAIDLHSMNLSGLILVDADLLDADLSQAKLVGVQLDDASLASADLSSADLTGASLVGVSARVQISPRRRCWG